MAQPKKNYSNKTLPYSAWISYISEDAKFKSLTVVYGNVQNTVWFCFGSTSIVKFS